MAVITACKCKKIGTMDAWQKINSKYFINFLCYFSSYLRPFWKFNHVSSSQLEKRVTLRISNDILMYCSQFGLSLIKVKYSSIPNRSAGANKRAVGRISLK